MDVHPLAWIQLVRWYSSAHLLRVLLLHQEARWWWTQTCYPSLRGGSQLVTGSMTLGVEESLVTGCVASFEALEVVEIVAEKTQGCVLEDEHWEDVLDFVEDTNR